VWGDSYREVNSGLGKKIWDSKCSEGESSFLTLLDPADTNKGEEINSKYLIPAFIKSEEEV